MRSLRLLLLLALAAAALPARAEEYVVIRNTKNATAELARAKMRELFLGRSKVWPSGELVQLILGPEKSPEMDWIAGELFNASDVQMRAQMQREVFRGELKRPLDAPDAAEAIRLVKKTPGGVAVVAKTVALPEGVAVLKVTD